MTNAEVRLRLEDAIKEAGFARVWARAHGIPETAVSRVRNGGRLTPEILQALGLKMEIVCADSGV